MWTMMQTLANIACSSVVIIGTSSIDRCISDWNKGEGYTMPQLSMAMPRWDSVQLHRCQAPLDVSVPNNEEECRGKCVVSRGCHALPFRSRLAAYFVPQRRGIYLLVRNQLRDDQSAKVCGSLLIGAAGMMHQAHESSLAISDARSCRLAKS